MVIASTIVSSPIHACCCITFCDPVKQVSKGSVERGRHQVDNNLINIIQSCYQSQRVTSNSRVNAMYCIEFVSGAYTRSVPLVGEIFFFKCYHRIYSNFRNDFVYLIDMQHVN
jgi:hypothetical protein